MKQKIIFPSALPGGLSAPFDLRFGRCQAFTVVEQEDGKVQQVEVINNAAINAMGGAGIQAAQTVGNQQPTHVVVGNLGPNAAMALQNINSEILQIPAGSQLTVKQVLDMFNEGKLVPMQGPNVGSHFGMGGGRGGGRGMGGGRGGGRGGRQF